MIRYSHSLPTGLEIISDSVVRKTPRASCYETVFFMKTLCEHLINHPDPLVVPIYNFSSSSKRNVDGTFEYSYDMMRLGMLSKEDKNFIRSRDKLTGGNVDVPVKPNNKLKRFIDIVSDKDDYWDLHCENVLIDLEEEYKLIDIEGFFRYKIGNNWIKQWS
jgi:hypothetical protein